MIGWLIYRINQLISWLSGKRYAVRLKWINYNFFYDYVFHIFSVCNFFTILLVNSFILKKSKTSLEDWLLRIIIEFLWISFIKWVLIKWKQNHRSQGTFVNNDKINFINEFKSRNRQKKHRKHRKLKNQFSKSVRRYCKLHEAV